MNFSNTLHICWLGENPKRLGDSFLSVKSLSMPFVSIELLRKTFWDYFWSAISDWVWKADRLAFIIVFYLFFVVLLSRTSGFRKYSLNQNQPTNLLTEFCGNLSVGFHLVHTDRPPPRLHSRDSRSWIRFTEMAFVREKYSKYSHDHKVYKPLASCISILLVPFAQQWV